MLGPGRRVSSHVPRWWKERPGLRGSGSTAVLSCVASGESKDLSEPQFLHPQNWDNDMHPAELSEDQTGLLLTGRSRAGR